MPEKENSMLEIPFREGELVTYDPHPMLVEGTHLENSLQIFAATKSKFLKMNNPVMWLGAEFNRPPAGGERVSIAEHIKASWKYTIKILDEGTIWIAQFDYDMKIKDLFTSWTEFQTTMRRLKRRIDQ